MNIQPQFAAVARATREVLGFSWQPAAPDGTEAVEYLQVDPPFDVASRPGSPTQRMFWEDGAVVWRETAGLPALRARAIEAIDAAAEALRLAVVNGMPTQTEEYRRVEEQARAWRDAGYPESEASPAPRGVRGWAAAKWRAGWSNRQACDDILASAGRWHDVLDDLRDLRLLHKEDARHADDADALAAIVADMQAGLRSLAAQLELTLIL